MDDSFDGNRMMEDKCADQVCKQGVCVAEPRSEVEVAFLGATHCDFGNWPGQRWNVRCGSKRNTHNDKKSNLIGSVLILSHHTGCILLSS